MTKRMTGGFRFVPRVVEMDHLSRKFVVTIERSSVSQQTKDSDGRFVACRKKLKERWRNSWVNPHERME